MMKFVVFALITARPVRFSGSSSSNDAQEDDPDFPDSALEIIRDELAIVDPEIGKISLKRLHNAAQKFATDNGWFAY